MSTAATDLHGHDGRDGQGPAGPAVPRTPADVVDATITAALLHGVEGRYGEALDVLTRGAGDVAGFAMAALAMLRESGGFEFVSFLGDDDGRALIVGHHLSPETLAAQADPADAWGPLRFLPAERLVRAEFDWVPDLEKLDHPDAWDADDWFVALLEHPDGTVRGVLTLDAPFDGMRPDAAARARLTDYVTRTAAVLEHLDARHRVEQQLALAASSREVIRRADARQGAHAVVEACAPGLLDALRADSAWFHVVDGPSVAVRRAAEPADPGSVAASPASASPSPSATPS